MDGETILGFIGTSPTNQEQKVDFYVSQRNLGQRILLVLGN